ncbi:MAG: PqqD family peptide modification chaperone [Pyrinomonadaceae bacterium]|nr:PqqD family peptide modification chaperone [Pyrinomonadaceae bacterium]
MLPIAKTANIVVQELSNETLVYDVKSNKAICLNSSAAFVWKNCDGENDVQKLMNSFQGNFNLKINEDFISLTLDELAKADLIEGYETKFGSRISRRKVLLNYALPMAMLPVITTLIAPLSSQAASGPVCAANSSLSCSNDAQCVTLFSPFPPTCFIPGTVCSAVCDPTNCCQFQEGTE